MKVHPRQPKFEPVTITLETQDEVDAMFSVLNHATLAAALKFSDQSREDLLPHVNDYDRFHTVLCDLIWENAINPIDIIVGPMIVLHEQ